MKKNIPLIIIVLILAVTVSVLYVTRQKSTLSEELRDFGVKDTASIVKVFMANKTGQQVLLTRQSNGDWLLDGKYLARPDGMKILLASIHDIEVRSPVAKAAFNNVIKNIAANGIKVELYNNKGLIKTFYVGGATQDQLGTFMYLENSTIPFICHIPGFDGYLTPRFITNAADWRIKTVFRIDDAMLKKLKIVDREQPDKSFTLINQNGTYQIQDGSGNTLDGTSQDKIINYLQSYQMVNYEMDEKSLSGFQLDSLRASVPFRTIELVDKNDSYTKVDLWRRPITGNTTHKETEDGIPFKFDVDRMTASINEDTALVVVQYFSFEKLFKKPIDFLMPESLK